MTDFTRPLPAHLLLALYLVAEDRVSEVDLETLQELLEAGLVARVSVGWVLSGAGARRVRSFEPALREELAALSPRPVKA